MCKGSEIKILAKILADRGMEYDLAVKNLLECDREFIDKLANMLRYAL